MTRPEDVVREARKRADEIIDAFTRGRPSIPREAFENYDASLLHSLAAALDDLVAERDRLAAFKDAVFEAERIDREHDCALPGDSALYVALWGWDVV